MSGHRVLSILEIVVVLVAAFVSGMLIETGVVAMQCERTGQATIAFRDFTCQRAAP